VFVCLRVGLGVCVVRVLEYVCVILGVMCFYFMCACVAVFVCVWFMCVCIYDLVRFVRVCGGRCVFKVSVIVFLVCVVWVFVCGLSVCVWCVRVSVFVFACFFVCGSKGVLCVDFVFVCLFGVYCGCVWG